MVGGNGLEPMTSAMRGQGLGLRKIHRSHLIHNIPPKAVTFFYDNNILMKVIQVLILNMAAIILHTNYEHWYRM
jgi:hypothetical protein